MSLSTLLTQLNEYTVCRGIRALPRREIKSSISEIIDKYQHHITVKNIKNKRINSLFGFEETTYSKIRQLATEFIPIINPMGIETDSTQNSDHAKR